MPRVTCRCGHKLKVLPDSPDRVVCPQCSAKIRVRRAAPGANVGDGDGFIRFACPCGRRLKVRAAGSSQAGKCPDCGRVVPVPTVSASTSSPALPTTHPEARTEELSPAEVAMLDQWARGRLAADTGGVEINPSTIQAEAGLRVCPRCGRPVHLGAIACRECGAHVPKR